jgi:tetratricopeptide (TPR) repeat protein
MTGGDDDRDNGRPDGVPIAETLDEMVASDDSGLCAGLLDVLALLPDIGAARWVLHRAGRLALLAAPGGYGFRECFSAEVIDAALGELAEAGLVIIDEAVFDDAGDGDDDDADVAGEEPAGEPHGFEGPDEADDAWDQADDAGDEDVDYPEDPDDLDDYDLDDSAFDTVTVDPDAGKIIMERHVAAGAIAELGARACAVLEEAALSRAGIDYALLADGMTACWDSLQPHLGPADDELVKDLLTMRGWGLGSLIFYPDVSEAELIEFGERLVADCERALGPGHPDAWEARRNMAFAYERCQRNDEAIAAFARLRADMEGVLPADDGQILATRENLAFGYMNAGRYDAAVMEFTQLLADYERVGRPWQHNLTLSVRGELGEALLEVGRVAEGIELMEAAAAGLAALWPGNLEVARLREAIDEARGQEAG